MYVNNNLYLLQETSLLKYIFNQKLSPMYCVGNQSVQQPIRLWICHPLRSFHKKYIPGSDPYSPPSASLSCLSLVPFSPPFSSQYPSVQFTIMFIAIFVCQDLCMFFWWEICMLVWCMLACLYVYRIGCQGVCLYVESMFPRPRLPMFTLLVLGKQIIYLNSKYLSLLSLTIFTSRLDNTRFRILILFLDRQIKLIAKVHVSVSTERFQNYKLIIILTVQLKNNQVEKSSLLF